MDNFIDIMYYESLIEFQRENQKILEVCMESKAAIAICDEKLLEETSAICENQMLDSIFTWFKKIFDKLVEYLKGILDFMTQKDTFSPNKNLINACEQKIKLMTKEDRDAFIIKDVLISDSVLTAIESLIEYVSECSKYLNDVMEGVDSLVQRLSYMSALDTIIDRVEDINTKIDQKFTDAKVSEKPKTVSYKDIIDILNNYKHSKEATKDIKKASADSQKTINACKQKVDRISKSNIAEKLVSDNIQKYQQGVYSISNLLVKSYKIIIHLAIMGYKNQESVLVQFANWQNNNGGK